MAYEDVYSTDAHLGFYDQELFSYFDVGYRIDHRSARTDVERELLRRNFPDGVDNIKDTSAVATVTLTVTAKTGDGGLVLPAGFEVSSAPDRTKVTFTTDAELSLDPGAAGTVTATCTQFGEPGNVDIQTLVEYEHLARLESIENLEPAVGGRDHQLTKACAFRALYTIYSDLSRVEGDRFDYQMKRYLMKYREELDLVFAAGLLLSSDPNDLIPSGDNRARGALRLTRS